MSEETIKNSKKQIGSFIRSEIDNRGFSIEGISRKCGYNKSIIYNIMNGKGYTIDSLLILVHVLGIENELFEKPFSKILPQTI